MNQSKPQQESREKKPQRSLGKKLTYGFSIFLLLVIAVTFIGTPALRSGAGSSRPVFGKYAGKEIVPTAGNYFARTYQNVADYYQQSGAEITDQVYYSVWQTAYYETVFHMALLHEAEKSGVDVSTQAVDRAIARWPAFQVNGLFSQEAYMKMSSPNRLALRQYLKEVLVDSQVRSDISSAATFSDSELAFLGDMASPQRRFRFVQFGFSDYPDSEVVAYGEENRERFRQINVSQITIDSSRADAQSIRQQAIDRTSSFEDLARNQSSDEFAADGGDRGWTYYWDLEFDFEDVSNVDDIFSLAPGEISPVFQAGTGFRIYKVNEAPMDPDFTDAETVQDVRDYLNSYERGRLQDYLTEIANVFATAARTDGFAAAASTVDQQPQLTDYFPVNYGNAGYFPPVQAPSNAVISNAGAFREEFIQTLFALQPGEVSEPQVLRDYVLVLQLQDEKQLDSQETETLVASLPSQLQQAVVQEANQAVVDDSLFEDNFNQTYSRVMLGQ